MQTVLFLLYNDEDISQFKHPNVIPVKLNQTKYFESEFFRMIEALPQAENYGIITPSLFNKMTVKKSLDQLITAMPNPIIKLYDVHPRVGCYALASYYHGEAFSRTWNWMLDQHGISQETNSKYAGFYANLWISKRDFFIEFLAFAKKTIQMLENAPPEIQELLNSDSKHVGSLCGTGKLKEKFGYDWYPQHPFIMERLICLFTFLKSSDYV
jgi:hypothetical protein